MNSYFQLQILGTLYCIFRLALQIYMPKIWLGYTITQG